MHVYLFNLFTLVNIVSASNGPHSPVHSHRHARRMFGLFSELAGTTFDVDTITSPGQSRTQAAQISPGSLPQNSSSPSSLSRQTNGLSTSTCAVSFSPELTNPTTTTIPGQTNSPPGSSASLSGVDPTPNGPSPPRVTKRDLLNQLSLSDKESSALYMTEVADSCVQAMRGTSGLRGEVLHPGVVTCYSLGYKDISTSTFGGHLSVFRLGDPAVLEALTQTSLEDLSKNASLELMFAKTGSSSQNVHFVKSTKPGAFDFGHPSLAPSDDPDHLINPTNPHYTASCGGKQMVLIGTFHINLYDANPQRPSLSKRDELNSIISPVGMRLAGRGTHDLGTRFFDLTATMTKRSELVQDSAWGLFKRSTPMPLDSRGNFLSDSACLTSGLSLNPFFTGVSNGRQDLSPTPPPATQPVDNFQSLAAAPPSSPTVNNFQSLAAAVPLPTSPATPSSPPPPPPSVPAPIAFNPLMNPTPDPSLSTPLRSVVTPTTPPLAATASAVPLAADPSLISGIQPPSAVTLATAPQQIESPSAAAEAETPSATAFQLPGRSIMVLPVGLAIFGGVSLIALIVVGVVTYERRRYRQQFRQRKMREQIANAAGFQPTSEVKV